MSSTWWARNWTLTLRDSVQDYSSYLNYVWQNEPLHLWSVLESQGRVRPDVCWVQSLTRSTDKFRKRYFQFVKQSRHFSWGSRKQTFHLSLCWVPQTKLTICAHVDESYRFYLITTSQTAIIPVCLLVKQIPELLRKRIERCLITSKNYLPKTLTINI